MITFTFTFAIKVILKLEIIVRMIIVFLGIQFCSSFRVCQITPKSPGHGETGETGRGGREGRGGEWWWWCWVGRGVESAGRGGREGVVVVVQTIENSPCLFGVEPACFLLQTAALRIKATNWWHACDAFHLWQHIPGVGARNQPTPGEEKGRVADLPHPLVAQPSKDQPFSSLRQDSPKNSTVRLPAVLLLVILKRFTGRSLTGSSSRKWNLETGCNQPPEYFWWDQTPARRETPWKRELESNGASKCHHKAQLLLLQGTQRIPESDWITMSQLSRGREERPCPHCPLTCNSQVWCAPRRPEQTMNGLAPCPDLIPTAGWETGTYQRSSCSEVGANNFFTSQLMTSTLLKHNKQLEVTNNIFTEISSTLGPIKRGQKWRKLKKDAANVRPNSHILLSDRREGQATRRAVQKPRRTWKWGMIKNDPERRGSGFDDNTKNPHHGIRGSAA